MSSSNQGLKELADLIGGKSTESYDLQLSANDVLVQISLPMILILAIVIQLMQITVVEKKQDETFLEPWKQQFLLRISRVEDRLEKEWNLSRYKNASDISFGDRFPADPDFSVLMRKSQELADLDAYSREIYRLVLAYDPVAAGENADSLKLFREMWDKESRVMPTDPTAISGEYVIDAEKRTYALTTIQKRISNWKSQVEGLQWSVVGHVVNSMKLDDALSDDNSAAQMIKIARELDRQGYPLLPSVINEYSK